MILSGVLCYLQTCDALSSSHTSCLTWRHPATRSLNTWLIVFISLPSGRTYLRRKKRQRQTSSTSRPCWMYLLNSLSSSGTYGNGKTSRETSSSLVVTTQSKEKKKIQTVNTQRAVHMEIKLTAGARLTLIWPFLSHLKRSGTAEREEQRAA